MNKLDAVLLDLKMKNEGALMAHVYFGDPNGSFSLKLIETLVKSGADMIEFGIPFADPVADGPTFYDACYRSLKNGTTVKKCIDGIREIRSMGIKNPIVVTTYFAIPFKMGVGSFIRQISEAGAQAAIIPDVPIEEAEELLKAGKEYNIHIIFLITTKTTDKRMGKIIAAGSGFLYIVNFEGVTGVRSEIQDPTTKLISKLRKMTTLPILSGFGISKPEHIGAVMAAGADGATVGSAIAKIYEKDLKNPESKLEEVASFVKGMKEKCII